MNLYLCFPSHCVGFAVREALPCQSETLEKLLREDVRASETLLHVITTIIEYSRSPIKLTVFEYALLKDSAF